MEAAVAAFKSGEYEVMWPFNPSILATPDAGPIVIGRIVGFEAGPTYDPTENDGRWATPTTTVALEVTEVIKGEAAPGDVVYAQLGMSIIDPAEAEKALPAGSVALLYLQKFDPKTDSGADEVDDPSAGRPEGSPVWAVGPLSFIVANGNNNGTLFPLLGTYEKDQDLDSRLP